MFGRSLPILDALRRWTLRRTVEAQERDVVAAALRNGLADAADGRTTSADDVFDRLERKYARG